MNLKKLEKGCIVFNVDKENGYKVAVVDNTGSNTDAHYWVDNFLHVRNCNDDYHETERLMEMCTGFVSQLKEQSVVEGAVAAKKTAEAFSTGEPIQVADLADIICQNEEQKQAFEAYRQSFEKEYGDFSEEVNVVKKAASRKPVTRMNTLKLGADFEVKVLNPEARIEGGVDKKSGKKYYTLYYEG
jgi:hypothetical protein